MKRLACVGILLLAVACFAADPKPIAHDVHGGYFVSNKFEPNNHESFLVIRDQEHFDRVFGAAYVMNDKSNRLPKGAFDSKMVLAVIKRGKALCTFAVNGITAGDGVLSLTYTVNREPHATAEFACPLIISVPKGDYTAVEFTEGDRVAKRFTWVEGFTIAHDRAGMRIKIAGDAKHTVIDISGAAIGGATIIRTGDKWPEQMVLRVHLTGLEKIAVASGNQQLNASVLSHSGFTRLMSLWTDGKEGPSLKKDSPCWMEINAFGPDGKSVEGLPAKGGWFEMTIPRALLDDKNPDLGLHWIDFFRG